AALLGLPHLASTLAAWRGDPGLEPSVALGRYATMEDAFRLVADSLVARKGFDSGYDQYLQRAADYSGAVSITIPDVQYTTSPATPGRHRPDIFVFVIDSLRRDYLSTFNPAVTFTPNFGQFAADSFAFRNAFTRHGGTELAMPSIWAGAAVVRKVVTPAFTHLNALEKLVDADHYRMAINEHTVADYLGAKTPVTMINPDVPNVDTDFCQNLNGLETYLDASVADPGPVFGMFRPMNIHILNTMRGGQRSLDHDYPGFYAPYASRVRRMDGCFGAFISYLKQRGRYDDSIIIVTADHGDSLGEDGNWGHAVWLFPEIVRIPLIIHVPPALRQAVTTDLARVAFTTDIAPTLYALLGHPVRDLGQLFGAPLFVPSNQHLIVRRRDSFLLTSSYGATFGLLRRNGRLLYVSDLTEWREYAYDLSQQLIATPLVVDDDVRRVNQRLIRERVADAERFYRVTR
ncbi:MAG TPA: sulfatase-like hydrolase/transferase, partial [Vicinamibacterales bacterium]|nr:sulfatase-like hydrolase/transferase [Vicinamibacterales bacterium]